jgi:alpha-galactosidase
MSIKISIIGAGSAVFSLSLIRDICTTPRLQDATISLMDIDEKRLNAAFDLCVRYGKEQGRALRIEKTGDRIECIRGADFVINTALHVNYDMWRRGWAIAQRYGYRYGGSLHIMHDEAFWINYYQFGLMENIYLDMQKVCPAAWYVLVANPVLAGVTYLKRKYPDSKIVGLCHGFNGVFPVAEQLGYKRADVQFELSGVNHSVWMNHFTLKGQDGFAILDRWIVEKSAEHFRTEGFCSLTGPKIIDIYRRYGAYPIGDNGNPGGGAWGWWYHTDAETEKRWNDDPARWFKEIYFEANERMLVEIARAAADVNVRVSKLFPPEEYVHEPMIPLIESIAFDIPRLIIVNVQNTHNYVEGIPNDFEVEIPALVSANGVAGTHCKPLPKAVIASILRDRVAPVETELAAYADGSYETLLSLILMDPWTTGEAQARQFLDEILEQPELVEMKDHYRKLK